MRQIFVIVLFLLEHLSGICQCSTGAVEIVESLEVIQSHQLFQGWKEFAADSLNPTFGKLDINKDGRDDFVGFYTGIDNGLFVFLSDHGEYKIAYAAEFDASDFINGEFQSILNTSGDWKKNSANNSSFVQIIKNGRPPEYLFFYPETSEITRK